MKPVLWLVKFKKQGTQLFTKKPKKWRVVQWELAGDGHKITPIYLTTGAVSGADLKAQKKALRMKIENLLYDLYAHQNVPECFDKDDYMGARAGQTERRE